MLLKYVTPESVVLPVVETAESPTTGAVLSIKIVLVARVVFCPATSVASKLTVHVPLFSEIARISRE